MKLTTLLDIATLSRSVSFAPVAGLAQQGSQRSSAWVHARMLVLGSSSVPLLGGTHVDYTNKGHY